MKRYLLAVFLLVSLQSCTGNDPEKHELKSPCVSADVPGGSSTAPCQRRPINLDRVS